MPSCKFTRVGIETYLNCKIMFVCVCVVLWIQSFSKTLDFTIELIDIFNIKFSGLTIRSTVNFMIKFTTSSHDTMESY